MGGSGGRCERERAAECEAAKPSSDQDRARARARRNPCSLGAVCRKSRGGRIPRAGGQCCELRARCVGLVRKPQASSLTLLASRRGSRSEREVACTCDRTIPVHAARPQLILLPHAANAWASLALTTLAWHNTRKDTRLINCIPSTQSCIQHCHVHQVLSIL